MAALRNLRSALALSPAELPNVEALSRWTGDVAYKDELIDDALRDVKEALHELTAENEAA